MAALRKPKLYRLPKRPKAKASLDVWKRYGERCKEVEKKNIAKLKPYLAKKSALESAKRQKEAIKASVEKERSKIKSKLSNA